MPIIFQNLGIVFSSIASAIKGILQINAKTPPRLRQTYLELGDVSVGIICALPKELAAARAVFNCDNDSGVRFGEGGQRYFIATVQSRHRGTHIIALHMLDRAGNSVAAAQAMQMTRDCARLKYLIMCGIAGAVPNLNKADDHVRLGDIVYSEDVIQYDFGADYPAGFVSKQRTYNAHPRLVEAARNLDVEILSRQWPWESYIESATAMLGQEYKRPLAETDVLLDSDILEGGSNALSSTNHPSDPRRTDVRAEKPVVFRGMIASADHVLKHPAKRDDLRERFGVKAVEMEGHGIGYASWQSERGFIVVRGTCDYCNMNKGDSWQNYAAIVAAGYTRALIENLRVEHIVPGPRESTRHFELNGPPQTNISLVKAAERLAQETKDRPNVLAQETSRSPIEECETVVSANAASSNLVSTTATGSSAQPLTVGGTLKIPPLTTGRIDARLTAPMVKISGVIHGVATPTPTPANVASPSPLERQLLTSEGERRISETKRLLDVWEFESAVAMTDSLADWVELHEKQLPQDLRVQLYSQLARLEAVRASRQKDRGEAHDSKMARIFLEKARDAANR